MPKLNKSTIDKEPFPAAGQTFLRDSELKGFGVRITPGAKTFFIERRVNRKLARISIGSFPAWSVDKARTEAMRLMVEMDGGVDPRVRHNEEKVKTVTLKEVFAKYIEQRPLKAVSIKTYQDCMKYYFADWADKPLLSITAEMITTRHTKIGKGSSGESQANLAMRFLRALFYFAQAEYGEEVIPKNPVTKLSQKRQWFKEMPRQNVIKLTDMSKWFNCVLNLDGILGKMPGDFLQFVLFTGARSKEAAILKWDCIDFKEQSIVFMDTKNHTNRKIPLTDYVATILERRKAEAINEYVFGTKGNAGYYSQPGRATVRVVAQTGIKFSIHDLRRTYATILESLDVSLYALKALLGHSMSGDVTGAHYTVINIERLRPAAQKLEDVILRLAGLKESAPVVDHPAKQA